MNPYDREPAGPPQEQALTPVRIAATAAAALPAVGVGLLCLFRGIAEVRHPSIHCAVQLVLGAALLVLFVDVAAIIRRADNLGLILFAGVLGFAAAFLASTLAELGSVPSLIALAAVVTLWALLGLHRPAARTRA